MLQLTLCGTLCSEVNLSWKGFKKKKKSVIQIITQDISKLLSSNTPYIHYHVLNKLIQLTNSEFGIIGKPTENSTFIKYAQSHYTIDDIEKRIFDTHIIEDIYTLKKPYVDNKFFVQYPTIKRMLCIPIMSETRKIVAVLILCNKLKSYSKKEIIEIQMILNQFNYLFINTCFTNKNNKEY